MLIEKNSTEIVSISIAGGLEILGRLTDEEGELYIENAMALAQTPKGKAAIANTAKDIGSTLTNPLDIKPDDSYGQLTSQEGGDDSTGYMDIINKSLDKGVDWARGKLKKESMKTFKNYLDEVYKQRPNSPAPPAGGTIQSQGSVGSKRPTVKGQNADQTDMDAGKEQPDQFTKTITDQNGNVVAQVDGMDASDTMRGLRTSSKGTGKGQAIRKIAGLS